MILPLSVDPSSRDAFQAAKTEAALAIGRLQAFYIGKTVADLQLAVGQELTAGDLTRCRANHDQQRALSGALTIVLNAAEPV